MQFLSLLGNDVQDSCLYRRSGGVVKLCEKGLWQFLPNSELRSVQLFL